ncbi:MAG: AAA family ATPase [Nanoarchaeota archaeon]|nr:AAA family ATPase [Nanoarchaeota archaeon]
MTKSFVRNLFDDFNKKKVNYCVRGKYKHLPKTLNCGDVDILITKKDFNLARKIIKSKGFVFYPFTQPNLFYYYYDKDLGMIHLDILLADKFPKIKKYKNFYIPYDGKPIPNKKKLSQIIYTGIRRRLYYLLRGRVICFEGPDGSGKSTYANAVYEALKRHGLKKELIHFATPFSKGKKPSALKRLYTRTYSIIKTYKNRILGRITITDRYIYLTFRKSNPFLRKFLLFLTPTPDIVFVMKASPTTIRKRKKGQRDRLSIEMIKELYNLYESISRAKLIDTEKPIEENMHYIVNDILKKI